MLFGSRHTPRFHPRRRNLYLIMLYAFITIGTTFLSSAGALAKSNVPLQKIAIIKADDVRKISAEWDRFFALSKEKGVKISAGIVCNSLQLQKPDYISWLQSHHKSGWVEFWNHGWDHQRWETKEGLRMHEFNGSGYAHQKKHFDDAQSAMKKSFGVAPIAFGAPYNAVDSDTLRILHHSPDVHLLFTYKKKALHNTVQALMVLRGEADGTSKPNFEKFKRAYEKHPSLSFTALQFHPNGFDDRHFGEYANILDFMLDEGWVFMQPQEYVNVVRAKTLTENLSGHADRPLKIP